MKKGRKYQYFNPLSLYRERQRTELHSLCLNVKFQSTLPIQGETKMVRDGIITVIISIHSPYTGRDVVTHVQRFVANISIHSPYTGRDPLRLPGAAPIRMSIPSPYTGIVYLGQTMPFQNQYFNPLSLYTERRYLSRY